MEIIRSEKGSEQHIEKLSHIEVPDCWNIGEEIGGREGAMVLKLWHLCQDLLGALRSIEKGADLKKPIHTK